MIAFATIGLVTVASGCATFSDNDAVARVDDVSLSRDDFEARLTELGATDQDVISAEPVRAELTRWIQSQLIVEEEAAAMYDAGLEESGTVCINVIVVADEAAAGETLAALEDGAEFADTFAEANIDPQLNEISGALPCITAEDVAGAAGTPFIDEAAQLNAAEPLGSAPLRDDTDTVVAWVVLSFRPFDELSPEDADVVVAGLDVDGRAAEADIYVDPRYGVFDRDLTQVVALG